MRFIFSGEDTTLERIATELKKADPGYEIANIDGGGASESGDLSYGSELYATLEIVRAGEALESERAALIAQLAKSRKKAKAAVTDILRSARAILALQI